MVIKQAVPLLRVADVGRSIEWYRGTLGFVGDPFPASPPHEFAILRHGQAELMVRRGSPPVRSTPRQYDWDVYLRLEGSPFREVFAAFSTRGIVTRRLEQMFYGLAEFEITDPDGYVICLSQLLEDASDLPTPAGQSRRPPGFVAGPHHLNPNKVMKTLRNALLLGLAILVISSAWAEDSDATKKDMAQLQGEWSMVSGSADGQPLPDELRKQMKRVCKGNEATTTMGSMVILKAKITIDPSKKPKTIDYQMTDGVTKGKTQLGIYELEGDTFKSCFSAPDDPRPTDFTTKPGDHRTLTVWKHAKPSTPPEQK